VKAVLNQPIAVRASDILSPTPTLLTEQSGGPLSIGYHISIGHQVDSRRAARLAIIQADAAASCMLSPAVDMP